MQCVRVCEAVEDAGGPSTWDTACTREAGSATGLQQARPPEPLDVRPEAMAARQAVDTPVAAAAVTTAVTETAILRNHCLC